MQCETAAHRVSDVGRLVADFAELLRTAPQVGLDVGRQPVAGAVDRYHLVSLREGGHQRAPRSTCLGEAMNEYESVLTAARHVDVEHRG